MRILSGHTCDSRLILENDEPEASWSVRVAIVDDLHRFYRSEVPEIIFQELLVRVPCATDENFATIFVPHFYA